MFPSPRGWTFETVREKRPVSVRWGVPETARRIPSRMVVRSWKMVMKQFMVEVESFRSKKIHFPLEMR